MPSIGEIANEAKELLQDIKTNTLGTRNNTKQIITQLTDLQNEVVHLDATAQAGFANLAGGLDVLIQLGQQANVLASENVAQNATMICWLGKIAGVLCDIKHVLDASLIEQQHIRTSVGHIDSVLALVHSRETVEIDERDRLQAQIDACCGPETPEPEPCFSDCESPKIPPFRPLPVEWKPIEARQPDAPK